MSTPSIKVAILLGSSNDKQYFTKAEELLRKFEVGYEIKVLSAHRTPDALKQYIVKADQAGVSIFVGAAGGAAHLAGAIAAQTIKPVIGVPLPSSPLAGLDALLATVQMPGGVPVATVSIGEWGGKNAVILAIEILALTDKNLAQRLLEHRRSEQEKLLASNS